MDTFNAYKIAATVLAIFEEHGSAPNDLALVEKLAGGIRDVVGGCLANCQDDEPIFVLCARDLTAPGAVNAWANHLDTYPDPDRGKINDARCVANAMARWEGKKKLPGTTKAEKVFSG